MLSAFLFSITAILQLQHVLFTHAFISNPNVHRNSRFTESAMTPLLAMRNDDLFPTDDSSGRDHRFDIETLRQQFESLASTSDLYTMPEEAELEMQDRMSSPVALLSSTDAPLRETPLLDVAIPPRPRLTSIERERRSAEIELLGHLTDGEEAIKEIYNLWFNERGAAASKLLQQARELMELGPKEQEEAETILLALTEEYGVYFTGMYQKNRFFFNP
jgi:hypothetical protein